MNANDPAFPAVYTDFEKNAGLSIRAYLAGQALAAVIPGLLQLGVTDKLASDGSKRRVAAVCVAYADALIEELNKP